MGHVIEHIALEIQTLAGMFVGYGRTRSTDREGVYDVVFAYRVPEAGLYTARAAVEIARALVRGVPCSIDRHVDELKSIRKKHGLPAALESITSEAHELEIPFHFVNDSLLLLGYGINQVRMRGMLTSAASNIALEISDSRDQTSKALRAAMVRVLPGSEVRDEDDLKSFSRNSGTFVIKPLRGSHGRRITLPFSDAAKGRPYLEHTLANYRYAYAEQFAEGDLYRVLMIEMKAAAIVHSRKHKITADGRHTLEELVNKHLKDKASGPGRGYDPEMVPEKGQVLWIDGDPEEYADEINEETRFTLSRIAAHVELPLCTIDILASDITKPLGDSNGVVLTIDGQPSLTEFLRPARGNPRNVIRPLFKMLFNGRNNGRIPLIAIRGNGESTGIASMICMFCAASGAKPGLATSAGLEIDGHQLNSSDCTGRESVRGLLFDPCIDTAVVECSTATIVNYGLPFDTSDVCIITGSRAKAGRQSKQSKELEEKCDLVAGRTVTHAGHLVLNADNDCHLLAKDLYGQPVLYSTGSRNREVLEHCAGGGLGAIVTEGKIVVMRGRWETPLLRPGWEPFDDIVFLQTLLPAVLAAWSLGIQPQQIINSLARFQSKKETA